MKRARMQLWFLVAGVSLIVQVTSVFAGLSDGLMAHYTFDGNAKDISGNGNDGVENGGLRYGAGVSGSAAVFDGIDDYIRVPYDPSLNPTDQLSVSFWIKVDRFTNAWSPVFHKGGPGTYYATNREYSLWLDRDSRPNTFVSGSAGDGAGQNCLSGGYVWPGHWQHVIAVIDRKEHKTCMYVNGNLVYSGVDHYSSFNNNIYDLHIGSSEEVHYTYSPFCGRLDDLRFFNRVLDSADVQKLYNLSEYSADLPTNNKITVHHEDFESVTTGWKINAVTDGGSPFTRFLGRYAKQYEYKTFPLSGEQDFVSVAFDFYEIDTWDGETFYLYVNDQPIPLGEFNGYHSINDFSNKFNMKLLWPNDNGATNYGFLSYPDQGFRFELILPYSSNEIKLGFYSTLDQVVYDESWGIDNLTISEYYNGSSGNQCISVSSDIDLNLYQNSTKVQSITIKNPGNTVRTCSLEIKNQHPELDLSITSPSILTLGPDDSQIVELTLNAGLAEAGSYQDIMLKTSVDGCNTYYSNITVTVTEADAPDLQITAQDIELLDYTIGDSVTIGLTVHNNGNLPAANVPVQIKNFLTTLGNTTISSIAAGEKEVISLTLPFTAEGEHLIRVLVDSSNTIKETNEFNNEACRIFKIGKQPVASGNLLVTGSLPSIVYANELFTITGKAVYDVTVDGIRYTSYVVKGGDVKLTVSDSAGNQWVYPGIKTDVNGYFSRSLQAPSSVGNYSITLTATDETFSGKRNLNFAVNLRPAYPEPPAPPPFYSTYGEWTYTPGGYWSWNWIIPPVVPVPQQDMSVYSEDIHFTKINPSLEEEITIFANFHYWTTSTKLLSPDVPVSFYVTRPGSPKIKIGNTTISGLTVGAPDFGSRYAYTSWKNSRNGIYIVEASIDSAYYEVTKNNNAATRAIIVGSIEQHSGVLSGEVAGPDGKKEGIVIKVTGSFGDVYYDTTDENGFYIFHSLPADSDGEDYVISCIVSAPYLCDTSEKQVTVFDQKVTTANFLLYIPANCIKNLEARVKLNKVQLTWNHNGSSEYRVFRSFTNSTVGFTQIATTTNSYATYLDAGLANGQNYWYYVTSEDSCPSDTVQVAIPNERSRR